MKNDGMHTCYIPKSSCYPHRRYKNDMSDRHSVCRRMRPLRQKRNVPGILRLRVAPRENKWLLSHLGHRSKTHVNHEWGLGGTTYNDIASIWWPCDASDSTKIRCITIHKSVMKLVSRRCDEHKGHTVHQLHQWHEDIRLQISLQHTWHQVRTRNLW